MRSLQRRLTAGLLALFALLLLAGGGALYAAVRSALYAQFDDALRVKALVLITATDQRRGKVDVDFSDRFLREFDDDVATSFFQVSHLDGRSIEKSDSLEKHDLPRQFGPLEEPEFFNLPLPGSNAPARAIGIRFTPRYDRDDERTRKNPLEAVVVVAMVRTELDVILRRFAWIFAGGGAALLVATAVAVPLVLRPGLKPLRTVADQAAVIDANRLGARFPTNGMPAELRPICERLNELLARLGDSFERERRFSADLAHELLTPLAELRALAESAIKWPESAGPELPKLSLEILLRMEGLVTQLLELARAEAGRTMVNTTSVALPQLVREAWRPFAARAASRGLQVEFSGPEPCEVATDDGLLRLIVTNLLSNAAEYAPRGGRVAIAWRAVAGGFEFSAGNHAPALTTADLPTMFERFWRKDLSRTGTQHSGLGLCLARELARAAGGRLDATLDGDRWLTMTLRVPR